MMPAIGASTMGNSVLKSSRSRRSGHMVCFPSAEFGGSARASLPVTKIRLTLPEPKQLCIRAPLRFQRRSRPALDALQGSQAAWYANAMAALILPLIEAASRWPERGALIGLDLGTELSGSRHPIPIGGWRPAWRLSSARRSRPTPPACWRSPPNATRSASCSVCRSTWTAAKGRAGAVDPCLRPQFRQPTELADWVLGLAAFDRCGRTRTDRHGHEPRPPRRGDRRARRDLHPAPRRSAAVARDSRARRRCRRSHRKNTSHIADVAWSTPPTTAGWRRPARGATTPSRDKGSRAQKTPR